jgi:membrane-associated protease RseP (regulator of RpoE activity)
MVSARLVGVQAGLSDILLRLTAEGAYLAGRVTAEPHNDAVTSFSILVSRPLGGIQESSLEASSFVDADGQFSIGPIEPGQYLVRAVARGNAPSKPANLDMRAGETARANFVLAKGARLVGKVLNGQSGKPIPNARVEGEGPNVNGGLPIQIEASTTAGPDGAFELSGLNAGPQSVAAGARGFNTRIVSGLQLIDGETVGPIELRLTPLADPNTEPKSEYSGIGAVVAPDKDALLVGQVVEGGGAMAAGLVTGDRILAIDGKSIADMGSFGAAAQHLQGPPNSTVDVTVRHSNGQELTLTVARLLKY